MFNFNIENFKSSHYLNSPVIFRQGFIPNTSSLKEFYKIILNPLNGSHESLVSVLSGTQKVNPSVWSHTFPNDQGQYRDISALRTAIELKSSIVFDEYYRYSQEAKELVVFIQEQFNCFSSCNAYLSQKGGVAFPIHRDGHHVLIFALSGKKKWTVYNEKQDMYQAYNKIESTLTDKEIISSGFFLNEIMEAGDILYIPIGQFHSVENLTDNALHLTVSLHIKPLFTVLEDILLKIYSPESNFPIEVKDILNQINPIYQHPIPISNNEMLQHINILFDAIKQIVTTDDFIAHQNNIQKNKHLKICVSPTEELIEEMASAQSED